MLKSLIIMLSLLLFSVSDSSVRREKKTEMKGYRLVFSDEFNSKRNSMPDTTKWVCCKRYNAGWNRWISNSDDVAFIRNGRLICRAIPNTTEPNDTAPMLTGAIETKGKFSFKYGKVEVRLRTNNTRGNFPAAWMKPDKIDPDRYGEIDIFESFGDQGLAHQTIHNHLTTIHKKGRPFSVQRRVRLKRWHVYGVEWTPDSLIFSIDGEITRVFVKSENREDLKDGQWTFDRPFYLLLNQSVGEKELSDYLEPDTNFVYETQFDWVRVYQKKE